MQQEQQKVSSRSSSSSPELKVLNPRVVKIIIVRVEGEKNTLSTAQRAIELGSRPQGSQLRDPPIRRFERKKEAPYGLHRSCFALPAIPREYRRLTMTFFVGRGCGHWLGLDSHRGESSRPKGSRPLDGHRPIPLCPLQLQLQLFTH